MRKIDKIIWHCTATPEGRHHDIDDIRAWHTDPKPKGNGWSDVGYHFVILLDGTVQPGRPVTRMGAHCRANGGNQGSIAIAYVGGVDEEMKPKDTRTAQQKEALYRLTLKLLRDFPGSTVHGHNDFDALKACPSFDARADWRAHLERRRWIRTEDNEPDVEEAAKPATKNGTRALGAVTAATPALSMLTTTPWQTGLAIGGFVLVLLMIALAVKPLRLRLYAALGAPA